MSVAVPVPARHTHPAARAVRFVRRHLLTAYAVLALAYLMIPIAVVIAFSFNDPAGRYNYTWDGFTLDNWAKWNAVPGLWEAMKLSLQIALLTSLVATGLGTLMALALVRYGFRGRGATNVLIFLPMTAPEIVIGASLLTLFVTLNVVTGFTTILLAHIMFCVSFVVVTVRARLVGFDRHLEEAAMDLGANEWTTFWRVTFPLILPGVVAGALLAFALSVDDFVITYFVSGSEITFPLYVWGAARIGAPPQVNVFGTSIFLVAVLGMFLALLVQRRRDRA
ncbi:MAG: ABC transporter permease [Gaiellaceae bacterium]